MLKSLNQETIYAILIYVLIIVTLLIQWTDLEGASPLLHRKSQLAIGFLRNTGIDPLEKVQFLLQGGSYCPL